jgi:hypothetical protein
VPAGDVTTLIQDINTANSNGQSSNTIELAAGATYTVAAPVRSSDGARFRASTPHQEEKMRRRR